MRLLTVLTLLSGSLFADSIIYLPAHPATATLHLNNNSISIAPLYTARINEDKSFLLDGDSSISNIPGSVAFQYLVFALEPYKGLVINDAALEIQCTGGCLMTGSTLVELFVDVVAAQTPERLVGFTNGQIFHDLSTFARYHYLAQRVRADAAGNVPGLWFDLSHGGDDQLASLNVTASFGDLFAISVRLNDTKIVPEPSAALLLAVPVALGIRRRLACN